MPVSPEDNAAAARAVADTYRDAERAILAYMADRLRRGLDQQDWAQSKLDATRRVRKRADTLLHRALDDTQTRTDSIIVQSVTGAVTEAVREMRGFVRLASGDLRDQIDLDRLTELARARVDLSSPPITAALRTVVDAYRAVVNTAAIKVATGTVTRRQAAQQALWEWADKGITSFTSRDGRRWDIASYAEMGIRTATARAALDAHTESLRQLGQELVMVSDAPQECSLCRPWEGAILWSTQGPTGPIQANSAVGDGTVTVTVSGTLLEARTAGLYHPNCRHQVSAFLPGATTPPTMTRDPEGNAAREQLRYLERQVRQWKRREAAALSPAAARQARQKVRAYQARIREHVAETPAKRQPQREQINQAR